MLGEARYLFGCVLTAGRYLALRIFIFGDLRYLFGLQRAVTTTRSFRCRTSVVASTCFRGVIGGVCPQGSREARAMLTSTFSAAAWLCAVCSLGAISSTRSRSSPSAAARAYAGDQRGAVFKRQAEAKHLDRATL